MGEKRNVNPMLKSILDWDVKVSRDFLAAIIKRTGPMRHYRTVLKGLEVSFTFMRLLL